MSLPQDFHGSPHARILGLWPLRNKPACSQQAPSDPLAFQTLLPLGLFLAPLTFCGKATGDVPFIACGQIDGQTRKRKVGSWKMSVTRWLCIIPMMLATFPTIHVILCSSHHHARIISSPRLALDHMDPGSMSGLGSHFALQSILRPLRLRGGVQGWVDTTQEKKKVWHNKRHGVSTLSPLTNHCVQAVALSRKSRQSPIFFQQCTLPQHLGTFAFLCIVIALTTCLAYFSELKKGGCSRLWNAKKEDQHLGRRKNGQTGGPGRNNA